MLDNCFYILFNKIINSFFALLVALVILTITSSPISLAQKSRATYKNLINLPIESRVPGGLSLIPVSSIYKPEVLFSNKKVTVFDYANSELGYDFCKKSSSKENCWVALVAIPIETIDKPKVIELEVFKTNINNPASKVKERISFTIEPGQYAIQKFDLPRSTNYTQKEIKTIRRDLREIGKAFRNWTTPDEYPIWELSTPVPKGIVTSPYGNSRMYNNDGVYRFHKGFDIAHPQGTPIKSVGRGVVVLSENLFLNGNTVIVDHGYGLLSLYAHMDEISANVGNIVTNEDTIGTVGTTGRSTGNHLHLGISLNSVTINPELFIPELSSWR